MSRFALLFLLSLVLPTTIIAQISVSGRSIHETASRVDVGQNDYSVEEIIRLADSLDFQPISQEVENIDFTNGHHWVQFRIDNPANESKAYYFETARPVTDLVELFRVENGEVTEQKISGDNIPFDQKDYDYRSTIFNVKMPPRSSQRFYLHLKSDGEMIVLPMKLYTADEFIYNSSRTQFAYGIFYGLLLIAAIVYLFFYTSLVQRTFLYYGLYIISFGLLQFTLDGYMHQYVFQDGGWFYGRFVMLMASAGTIFIGLYAQNFLKIENHFTFLPKIFRAVYILVGVLVIGFLLSDQVLVVSYPAINGLALLFILLIIGTVVTLQVKGVRVDIFFSLGMFFLITGLVVFILNNFSAVPSNFFTQNSSKIGGALEIIFLSLSMSNLIRDLREEKEESQRLALVKSEEANDLKLYLMSNVSHELRTPLNAIMNIAQKVIGGGKIEENTLNDMRLIERSSSSLLGSINNLLDFYKIEKEELVLKKEPVALQTMLDELVDDWSVSAKEKGLSLQLKNRSEQPAFVWGDRDRLEQIISNLIENAIKFTNEGEIDVVVKGDSKINRYDLRLEVIDRGVGIPEDRLKDIFSSFRQERVDDKRAFGGLGLGLSIVKQLVGLFNGKIEIDSTLGLGTRCIVQIPFDLVPKEDHPVIEVEENNPSLPELNILVVEDNMMNQMVMKMTIGKWDNVTCDTAENGQIALEKLKEGNFDMVFMDLQMPVMDGYEATEKIRSGSLGGDLQSIPIIAVTADITEQAKKKVVELGMDDYQSKPITGHALYNKVYAILKARG